MKQMTIAEMARKFHQVIQEVEIHGEEFVVARKAQPLARIVPEPPRQTALKVMGDLFGILDEATGAAWFQAIETLKQ